MHGNAASPSSTGFVATTSKAPSGAAPRSRSVTDSPRVHSTGKAQSTTLKLKDKQVAFPIDEVLARNKELVKSCWDPNGRDSFLVMVRDNYGTPNTFVPMHWSVPHSGGGHTPERFRDASEEFVSKRGIPQLGQVWTYVQRHDGSWVPVWETFPRDD